MCFNDKKTFTIRIPISNGTVIINHKLVPDLYYSRTGEIESKIRYEYVVNFETNYKA